MDKGHTWLGSSRSRKVRFLSSLWAKRRNRKQAEVAVGDRLWSGQATKSHSSSRVAVAASMSQVLHLKQGTSCPWAQPI